MSDEIGRQVAEQQRLAALADEELARKERKRLAHKAAIPKWREKKKNDPKYVLKQRLKEKLSRAAYYERNKEDIKRKQRERNATCDKEAKRAYNQAYYERNKEELKQYQ